MFHPFFHFPPLYQSNTKLGHSLREVHEIKGLKEQSQAGTRDLTILMTLQSNPQTAALALEELQIVAQSCRGSQDRNFSSQLYCQRKLVM